MAVSNDGYQKIHVDHQKKKQEKPPTSLARFRRVLPSVADILPLEDADAGASHGEVDTE